MATRKPHPAVIPATALLCVGSIAAVMAAVGSDDASEPETYLWDAGDVDTGVDDAPLPGTLPPAPVLPSVTALPFELAGPDTSDDAEDADDVDSPHDLLGGGRDAGLHPADPSDTDDKGDGGDEGDDPTSPLDPAPGPPASVPAGPPAGAAPGATPGTRAPAAPRPSSTPTPAPTARPTTRPAPAPSSSTPATSPVQGSCAASSAWRLDLDERFSSLNTQVWNVKNNTYADNEHSYLRSRNVTVSGGVLRIQARKESHGGRSYTSGYVETMRRYTVPTHFRAEVRAKLPMEQGMWPAPLWFRPADNGAGEIDLVETYGKDAEAGRPAFYQTIHTEYGSTHKQKAVTKRYSVLPNPSATDWHTYTMEKTAGKIVMYVDCVKTAEFKAGDPSWYAKYYDAGDRWNLRVNLQVGGSWGGLPDSRTDWAADRTAMQVDHIRTWVPAR